LRQNALSVIAVGPHIIDARTGKRTAVPARKASPELPDELQLSNIAMQIDGQSSRVNTVNKQ
jgi:hypothetical protein